MSLPIFGIFVMSSITSIYGIPQLGSRILRTVATSSSHLKKNNYHIIIYYISDMYFFYIFGIFGMSHDFNIRHTATRLAHFTNNCVI